MAIRKRADNKPTASAMLSFVFEEIKGKLGNAVCSRSPNGTIIKPQVKSYGPANPRANRKTKHSRQMHPSMEKTRRPTSSRMDSIRKVDWTQRKPNQKKRFAIAYNTFLALNAKRLQIDPHSAIRSHPPNRNTTATKSPWKHNCKIAKSYSPLLKTTPITR